MWRMVLYAGNASVSVSVFYPIQNADSLCRSMNLKDTFLLCALHTLLFFILALLFFWDYTNVYVSTLILFLN